MAGNSNRYSTYTTASVQSGSDGKNGDKTEKKDLWSSMLDGVASAKRLPEKNIILLGGSVDSQREFFESLSNSELRRTLDRNANRMPPVANSFALGYTYYDVLDADQEDTLARISLYTLTNPSPTFASLLRPLLTPQSIPNTLIVILLDWSQPWKWMRQLREWVLLLRTVLISLSEDCKEAMQEVMLSWRDRGRGGGINLDGTAAVPVSDDSVALPVGPGEWEDGLGLPLCVVSQNAEKMEYLEKNQGWKEEEFDVVLQFMRTVLLRHGASLIYTTPSTISQLSSLIHSSLGIHSLLKKQPLKHNVIDRDKIVVPPNWDSWGKIRVLREGFDVERVSKGWEADLDHTYPPPRQNGYATENGQVNGENGDSADFGEDEYEEEDPEGSTVTLYELAVQDPTMDALQLAGRNTHSTELEVSTEDTQVFLGQQLKILEAFKHKNDEGTRGEDRYKSINKKPQEEDEIDSSSYMRPTEAKVLEHIGPVQFNMGGIQVDADDMVQRLKDRQAYGSTSEPSTPVDEAVVEQAPQMDTENLQAFFHGLMNRRGGAAK
ncbi:putative dynein 1 light intermediate chain 1 [Cladorrhinum sp. PSN332]|nr:putative dynein 1 light intermediate chain 1 [Cladorrhinum sp. PSN332]